MEAALRYGSVCSGIEAASVAWHPLGWQPAWFSEIDAFPSAVLKHRFPGVPNHGDFTTILRDSSHPARSVPIDVLVGGTPCQAFSVAGLRKGFDDDRGNLTLEFFRLVGLLRPKWVVWENVPGVLNIGGGRAFGSILGAFRELGYGFAYRILDAQYFGVPQRRRRVFLVGHSGGDYRLPATVLFEPEGVFGNPPPSTKARKGSSRSPRSGAPSDSQRVIHRSAIESRTEDDLANAQAALDCQHGSKSVVALHDPSNALDASYGKGPGMRGGTERNVVSFRANMGGNDGAVYEDGTCGTRANNTQSAVTLIRESGQGYWMQDDVAETVDANVGQSGSGTLRPGVISFHPTQDPISSENKTHAISSRNKQGCATVAVAFPQKRPVIKDGKQNQKQLNSTITDVVRRLTPSECEQLQGFQPNWTQIPYSGKPASDSPRYKAIGNSMAVPVMRWIGSRIAKVEALLATQQTEKQ